MSMSAASEAVTPDGVNRPVWDRDAEAFDIEGWNDPGELATLLFVADLMRGGAALDLGVGSGRTYSLLRMLTSNYVGIDYTETLVRACRHRHPEADVRWGDARDLTDFDEASFDFVFFSCNGIDAVDHEGRLQVLAHVSRVLRPGGVFAYSTLNKDGPLFDCTPGDAPRTPWRPGSLLLRPPGAADEGPASEWTTAVRNWKKLRASVLDCGEYGVAPFAAHNFSLLTHFITMSGVRAELADHGFEALAVFPCESGDQLDVGRPADTMYFNVAARRVAAA